MSLFVAFRPFRRPLAAALAGLALTATACGGQGAQTAPTSAPTSAPAAPAAKPTEAPKPAAPAASPAAAAVPAVAASPAAAKPAAAASPTTATAAAAKPAASPAAAGGTRLTLVSDGSEARFRVQEQFANRPLPSDAVGSTRAVSGAIVLAPNGAIVPDQSKITLDLRTLKTNSDRRDSYIKDNTLQVDQFPNADLVPRETRGLPSPLPTSGEATFELIADLTVHGVNRPTTWEINARFGEQEVSGTAKTEVKMTDFGMTPPKIASLLSIEDTTRLEIDFRATRAATTAALPGGAATATAAGW